MRWEKNTLFEGLSPEEMALVHKCSREKTFEKGSYLIHEGELGKELYLLVSGQIEILKDDWEPDEYYRITLLNPGEVIGEMALFGDKVRIASARAIKETVVCELSIDRLHAISPEIVDKISHNLTEHFTGRLTKSNEHAVIALKREILQVKKRQAISGLIVTVITLLVCFQIIIRFMLELNQGEEAVYQIAPITNILVMVIVGWVCFRMVQKGGYPLHMYGLSLRNWRKALWESFIFTIPFMVIVVALKGILIHTSSQHSHTPLFQMGLGLPSSFFSHPSAFFPALSLILYVFFAPVQEFIFRGVIQSSFQRFLSGRYRTIRAVLVTNMLFVACHFFWDLPIAVFIPGLFWSWLCIRQRTIIGASLSHMILGVWLFYIVGLNL